MSTTPSYKKAVSIPQTATADTTLSNAGSIIACAVVADGFTLSQTDHAGVTTTDSRTYTATGMVPEQTDGRSNTTVATRSYAYDSLGRPSTRSTAKDGITHSDVFHYTKRSELVNANLNGVQHGYDYDNIGNREFAQENDNVAMYESNALNQYTSISENGAAAFVPQFDADGNQTLIKTETGIWSAVYNAENRPITFTNSENNTVVECQYDSMGRRTYKKVTTNSSVMLHQRYLYRGYLQIACIDLTRSHHPALWLITWDPTQPIATRPLTIQKDGTWYTYGLDLTKNVCEVFGSAGYIATTYTYPPYGEVTGTGNIQQPIQWSSEFYDSELALVYYNYRHYNPKEGKWIGRDKIVLTTQSNSYIMTHNNTVRYWDRLGLYVVLCFSYQEGTITGFRKMEDSSKIENLTPKVKNVFSGHYDKKTLPSHKSYRKQ